MMTYEQLAAYEGETNHQSWAITPDGIVKKTNPLPVSRQLEWYREWASKRAKPEPSIDSEAKPIKGRPRRVQPS